MPVIFFPGGPVRKIKISDRPKWPKIIPPWEVKGQGTGKQLWEPGKPYQNHKVVGQDFNDFGDLLAGSAWFSKQGWGTGKQFLDESAEQGRVGST